MNETEAQYWRERAKDEHHSNDDIVVYDDAKVSEADEGAWVEVWLWLPAEES